MWPSSIASSFCHRHQVASCPLLADVALASDRFRLSPLRTSTVARCLLLRPPALRPPRLRRRRKRPARRKRSTNASSATAHSVGASIEVDMKDRVSFSVPFSRWRGRGPMVGLFEKRSPRSLAHRGEAEQQNSKTAKPQDIPHSLADFTLPTYRYQRATLQMRQVPVHLCATRPAAATRSNRPRQRWRRPPRQRGQEAAGHQANGQDHFLQTRH